MTENSFFVVEDHSLTNLGIRQSIENGTGLPCVGFAATEQEAFEKLAELSLRNSLPTIIILDLFLGGDSGIDVLKEVKKHFPSVQVVVYSMYSNPGIVSLTLENGAKGFVSKASSETELIEAVKKISAGETYVPQNLITPIATFKSIFASLTKVEQAVLQKIIEKRTFEQISEELAMEEKTVTSHLSRIYAKTGCKNRDALIKLVG